MVVFKLLKLIYFYFIDLFVNIIIVESVLLAAFSISIVILFTYILNILFAKSNYFYLLAI